MSESQITTVCAVCSTSIDVSANTPDKRVTCADCGSTKRRHDASGHLEASPARISLRLKAKGPGEKKARLEVRTGASQSHSLGKLVDHYRLIDRGNDRYIESVTDYESGEVIHQSNELLSEHHGHGTAKKKG